MSEPLVDRGDVDGGFVADGELVGAGGHRTVAFEPVAATLHAMALLVGTGIECRWARLVILDRDGGLDMPPAGRTDWPLVLDALSASTRSGQVCGLPALALTGHSDTFQDRIDCGLSPRWLAVMTIGAGFGPAHSQGAAWSSARREIARAPWSAGSLPSPPGGALQVPLLRAQPHTGAPRDGGVRRYPQVINPAASTRVCSPVRICRHVPSRCQRRNRP